jgi:hypothetical protein
LSLEGEAPSVKVKVKSVGERELQVDMSHEEIRFFSGGKPLSFPLRIPPGNSRVVEFRFAPQTRTGSLRDYVLIKSNDPVRSIWSVYISRYVVTRKELKDLFERYGSVLGDRKIKAAGTARPGRGGRRRSFSRSRSSPVPGSPGVEKLGRGGVPGPGPGRPREGSGQPRGHRAAGRSIWMSLPSRLRIVRGGDLVA